jgi:hypothetical protein
VINICFSGTDRELFAHDFNRHHLFILIAEITETGDFKISPKLKRLSSYELIQSTSYNISK